MTNHIQHKSIKLKGKPVFEKLTVRPPFRFNRQSQDSICFLYILKGSYKVNLGDNSNKSIKREGLLMKCDAFVHDRLPDPETGNNDIIAIHLYPQLLSELYSKELPKILSTKGSLNRHSNLNYYSSCMLIANYINTLLLYFDLPEMIDDDWILLKIKEFIHLVSKTNYRVEIQELLRTLFSPNEYSFKKIIEANIISNLNSGELAQLTNTSQGNFHRKFKMIYGESPARYIRNRRLDYAANMIMATQEEITSIAYKCGFNSSAHFSTSFRNRFKFSPSDYRQLHALNN